MNSYRVIEVEGKFDINYFYELILSKPFINGSGFSINKKRNNYIEASHFFKKEFIIPTLSENGSENLVTYFDYIKTNFKFIIYNNKKFIIMINPPRESKTFIYDIKQLLPYFSSINIISPLPKGFYIKLLDMGFNVKVVAMDISGININNRGAAKMSVTSNYDIYNDSLNFIQTENINIRSLSMEIKGDSYFSESKISTGGHFKLSNYNETVFSAYLNIINNN